MNVQIITIGDEILIGQIVDTNSAWMAKQLNAKGFGVKEILSISDDKQAILQALTKASEEVDIILITGGLGPTKDDITKKTIAEFFGVEMYFDEATYNRIQRLFERWGKKPVEAHREQCYMPNNVTLLHNKMGTAPGMWFEENGKVFVSMPGVPYEMKYLMEHEVLSKLKAKFGGEAIVHRTIKTVGEGESRIAKRIEQIEETLPAEIKLAYLPGKGQVRLRLSARGEDEAKLKQLVDEKVEQIKLIIPELIYGYDDIALEEAIGNILRQKNKTLATAESCTGGYLAHLISRVPGASSYFKGSIIAYDNAVKESVLNVNPQTLLDHGAVSEQTVREMVKGALKTLNTDVAISISGIAGPTGGTEEKPVGTIWMAIGDKNSIVTQKLQLSKNRLRNIEYTGIQALNMIRKFLLQLELV